MQEDKKLEANRLKENELLLLCSRTHLDDEIVERVRSLMHQDLDWIYIYKSSMFQGVFPVFYWQLKKSFPSLIPDWIIDQAEIDFNLNKLKNLSYCGELIRVIRLFQKAEIPVLVFKGPLLAQVAYGNPALRQFIDLDFLIHERDFLKARKLLTSQEYTPQFTLTDFQDGYYLRLRSEYWFWNEARKSSIDLHWAILPKGFSFSPRNDFPWEKTCQVTILNSPVPSLKEETMVLFMAAHGAKHNWNTLGLITDFAEFIRANPQLDWDWLMENKDKLGTSFMLYLALYLAHSLYSIPIPPQVKARIEARPEISKLAGMITKNLFKQTEEIEVKISFLEWFNRDKVYRKTMDSWRDKIWYRLDNTITPTPAEWTLIKLPHFLYPLYFLIRPVRLFSKFLLLRFFHNPVKW